MAEYLRLVYLSPAGQVSFFETCDGVPARIGDAELVGSVDRLVWMATQILAEQMSTESPVPPVQAELARRMGARQTQISRWANGANLRLPPGHPGWKALCDVIMSPAAAALAHRRERR